MIITNNHKLPDAVIESIKNDPYTFGKADISVTSLIGPAQPRRILKSHHGEVTRDASDMVFALLGKAVHSILEDNAAPNESENRLYMDYSGKVISGQYDSFKDSVMRDYKVTHTASWIITKGVKPEHIAQLNILAELARRNGHPVERLAIIYFFRDWTASRAKYSREYPRSPIMEVKVRMWDDRKVNEYITERLHSHFIAENPVCTDEDRWVRQEAFAVMKKSRVKALKLFKVKDGHQLKDVLEWMEVNGGDRIDHRMSEARRCMDYCDAAPWCKQWKGEDE